MVAVSVRRMPEVAPVAVSVRRSPALSLRISPTVIARMPSARRAPAAVAIAIAFAKEVALVPDLDREAGVGGELAGVRDLVARQRPARLDEPAGRNLLPAEAAKTVEGDERRRLRASHPPAEPKRCRPKSILWTFVTRKARGLDMFGMTSSSVGTRRIGEEVRARIDRGGIDPEVPEHRRRGDEELRFRP